MWNPNAAGGRADALEPRLRELLAASGHTYVLDRTLWPGDAVERAERGADAFDAVIGVGGDGTLHEVANGLGRAWARHLAVAEATGEPPVPLRAALGALPVGTGNDFVRSLGVPQDLDAAAELLRTAKPKPIDLGRVRGFVGGAQLVRGSAERARGSTFFLNNLSIGYGASSVHAMEGRSWLSRTLLRGNTAYAVAGLRRMTYRPEPCTIKLDGVTRKGRFFEIHVGNGRYCGGGISFVPSAEPDDGVLDLTLIEHLGVTSKLVRLAQLQWGTLTPGNGVEMHKVRRVSVVCRSPLPIYLDGEPGWVPVASGRGEARLEVEVLPLAIRFLCGDAAEG